MKSTRYGKLTLCSVGGLAVLLLCVGAAAPDASKRDNLTVGHAIVVDVRDTSYLAVEVCPYCSTESCSLNESWHRTNILSDEQVSNKMASGISHYGPHPCKSGSCSSHKDCPEGEELPCADPEDPECGDAALLAAVGSHDLERTHALIEAAGGRVVLNTERQALQRFGCTGTVVTHIPLPRAVVAALTDDSVE